MVDQVLIFVTDEQEELCILVVGFTLVSKTPRMSAQVLGLYFTYSPALSSYLKVYYRVQCVDG